MKLPESEPVDDSSVNARGQLDVGDGHRIYWEDWGNLEGVPIFHLHGGPGSCFKEKHKGFYDPRRQRVVFHDQRGCGRSVPFAGIVKNTTQDLIGDIEQLRERLGMEKICVAGGSWGSTLALAYACAHPERVLRLAVWGIFLARQFEIDYVNEGYPRYNFPEEWQRFIELVPRDRRKNGDDIMRFYAEKIHSGGADSLRYAREWTLWESALSSIRYDAQELERDIFEDDETLSTAKLETHYFMNHCFMPENYLLDSVARIAHIPCEAVHGRFDLCTPPVSAFELKRAYGERLNLTWANSGHSSGDPEMHSRLKQTLAGL